MLYFAISSAQESENMSQQQLLDRLNNMPADSIRQLLIAQGTPESDLKGLPLSALRKLGRELVISVCNDQSSRTSRVMLSCLSCSHIVVAPNCVVCVSSFGLLVGCFVLLC